MFIRFIGKTLPSNALQVSHASPIPQVMYSYSSNPFASYDFCCAAIWTLASSVLINRCASLILTLKRFLNSLANSLGFFPWISPVASKLSRSYFSKSWCIQILSLNVALWNDALTIECTVSALSKIVGPKIPACLCISSSVLFSRSSSMYFSNSSWPLTKARPIFAFNNSSLLTFIVKL